MNSRVLDHDWFPRPLPANVRVGPRAWVYSAFAFVHCHSRAPVAVDVGHDTGIYNGTFFELGPRGRVEIGPYCTLVGAVVRTDARVRIGPYSLLAHEVVLADSPAPVPPTCDVTAALEPAATGEPPVVIDIGENCWIGARAILLAGARLGEGAIVGAGAVVDFEVPAFAVAAGNPARVVGWARPRGRDAAGA
ncbi:MAG: DapH/DapD/GlmU-related protein [Phycisphaerae bacterium]|nr:acyltransferase [Tepidisphaeraceae bacterium]